MLKFNSIQDVENHAKALCDKHGIPQTTIKWSSQATRRYGMASPYKMTITLSRKPIEQNLDKVYAINDLILHEIAHLLVGPGHGHDIVWKRKARQIGAVPEATVKVEQTERRLPVAGKYIYRCPNCGKLVHRLKKRPGMACAECCHKYNNGRWSVNYVFELQ